LRLPALTMQDTPGGGVPVAWADTSAASPNRPTTARRTANHAVDLLREWKFMALRVAPIATNDCPARRVADVLDARLPS
jgi:hypothetical protein